MYKERICKMVGSGKFITRKVDSCHILFSILIFPIFETSYAYHYRNRKLRIVPSAALSGSTVPAFNDVNIDDPDFEHIQCKV